MATVFITSDGCYSDYRVTGVYSTRELAERAKEVRAEENDVQELTLDDIPPTPPGLLAWRLWMAENGDVLEAERTYETDLFKRHIEFQCRWSHRQPCAILTMWARDKDHAIKIAAEGRLMALERGEWQREFARKKETA